MTPRLQEQQKKGILVKVKEEENYPVHLVQVRMSTQDKGTCVPLHQAKPQSDQCGFSDLHQQYCCCISGSPVSCQQKAQEGVRISQEASSCLLLGLFHPIPPWNPYYPVTFSLHLWSVLLLLLPAHVLHSALLSTTCSKGSDTVLAGQCRHSHQCCLL